MAEVTIPKEKMNYTIDLLITMVTDRDCRRNGQGQKRDIDSIFYVQRQEKHCMMRRQSCGALARHI